MGTVIRKELLTKCLYTIKPLGDFLPQITSFLPILCKSLYIPIDRNNLPLMGEVKGFLANISQNKNPKDIGCDK